MLLKRLYTSTELSKRVNEINVSKSRKEPGHEGEGKYGGTVPHCAVLVKRALN